MDELYKGLNEDQVKSLGFDDFVKIVTSRERRTLLRLRNNPDLDKLIKKVRKMKESGKIKPIKTHLREAVILPEWLGLTFMVYNGKEWKKLVVGMKHIGRRLGEFAHTTGPVKHSGPGVGATRGSKFVPLK